MGDHKIDLFLTNAQYKKFANGEKFQVTYQQLNKDKENDHHVEIELEKKEFTKLQRNIRNKKGFRFNPQKIKGSGILSSALSIGKQALQSKAVQDLAKKGASKALQMVANKSNNSLISNIATTSAKALGGRMAKGSVEAREHMARIRAMRKGSGIFDTVLSLGNQALQNKAIQGIAKKGLSKGLQMVADKSNNSLISSIANTGAKALGGKLTKDSAEAKEKMARIRAMRKGSGFNFLKSVGKIARNPIVKQIGQVALKTALPIALKAAQSNPYTAGPAMLASGVLQSQTGGKLQRITVPEMIKQSHIRPQHPIEMRGGSFRSLG